MVERATAVNPALLVWARQRCGYSPDEVAARIGKPTPVVLAWEAGTEAPTFRQLEHLAESVYQRPVALFFFPAPPQELDPQTAFRTLPRAEVDQMHPDTRYAMREALGYQESLRDLTGGRPLAERSLVRDLAPRRASASAALAAAVRSYLAVSIEEQSRWASSKEAFKDWRLLVEAAGVFVFKRPFKQRGISGLCLYDPDFPIMMINNSTAHARQVFTLFHELAHLLHAVGGVTFEDTGYIAALKGTNRRIEVECNRFAAEFLIPAAAFPWGEFRGGVTEEGVARVARKFNVSREVVLRRLLEHRLVDQQTYSDWCDRWNAEFARSRATASRGNYYATQATYLGRTFLQLAFSRFHAGALSLEQLAAHLGVKARNVARLEDFAVQSG